MNPVALPPGRAKLSTKPLPTGSVTLQNMIGTERVARNSASNGRAPFVMMTSAGSATNSSAYLRTLAGSPPPPSDFKLHIAIFGPTQLMQQLHKHRETNLSVCRFGRAHEHADLPYALALLRARRERPCGHRAAKKRDELAPFHCW